MTLKKVAKVLEIAFVSWLVFLAVLFAALVFWGPIVHADPARYVPADYDPTGVPDGPCQSADCFPQLWWWPQAPIHTLNLTGVRFAFWSPPMSSAIFPAWMPRAHVTLSANYWAKTSRAPAVGDTLVVSGYQDPRRTFLSGVAADSTSRVTGGIAVITASPADSVIEGSARLYLTNVTWAKPESLVTYFRLVEENYRR